MHCDFGHEVSTKMIYGCEDDDTDATTVQTACTSYSCCSSSTASTCFKEERPRKSIGELLDGVVLVGLWDTKKGRMANVGSGFIADNSTGLILTAGHIFYKLEEGKKVEQAYKNCKAIIGTIVQSKKDVDSTTAYFTYFAEIIAQDITNTDAVVLHITTKFDKPFQWPSDVQSDHPIMYGRFKHEKLKRLKLVEACLEEQTRVIGFNQSGEGLAMAGEYINHTVSFARGHVLQNRDSLKRKKGVFLPRSEIVVDCTSYQGQ